MYHLILKDTLQSRYYYFHYFRDLKNWDLEGDRYLA